MPLKVLINLKFSMFLILSVLILSNPPPLGNSNSFCGDWSLLHDIIFQSVVCSSVESEIVGINYYILLTTGIECIFYDIG